MYHLEIRQFPHNVCRFNLSERELLPIAVPWAREEWEPACYRLPAHRLQLAHGVVGASLIALIKAWTIAEGKKDQDILDVAANTEPLWPWSDANQLHLRLDEATRRKPAAATV